jgi:hypothetical protein
MRTREELRNVVGAGAISCTGRKVRRNASDFTRAWGIVNQEWKLDPRGARSPAELWRELCDENAARKPGTPGRAN